MAQVTITAVVGPIVRGATHAQVVQVTGTVDGIPVTAVVPYADLQSHAPTTAQQTYLAQQLAARKPATLPLTTSTPIQV